MNSEITNNFSALNEQQCGATSKCSGYDLSGSYITSQPLEYDLTSGFLEGDTTPEGESSLTFAFNLKMPEVSADKDYMVAFGFQNGSVTEISKFLKRGINNEDKTTFTSGYKTGDLLSTRSNKVATIEDNAW